MPRDIPPYSLPDMNRQVLLARRPAGVPQASDFEMTVTGLPTAGKGEMLVRNIYLSVDPAQRGWASAEANYSAPVPLGSPMRALALGVVVESHADGFAAGEFLYGWFGWQDYALARPDQVIHRATQDLPLTAFASLLGINGPTAWLALHELGRPKPGDTVIVSTAAGSVGSMVGQIAKSLGCRTIGITGSDQKVARCIESFGYDVAINYKSAHLDAEIARAAPQGGHVYFDNTGGWILDTVLRRLAIGARVVQCGTASIGSWTPPPTGPRNEREILTRRLIWSGFVLFDHVARYNEAAEALTALWKSGAVTYECDISDGIEHAAGAISSLYAGDNTGKKLIYVG